LEMSHEISNLSIIYHIWVSCNYCNKVIQF
jgi:hypothetical protein